VRLPEDDLDAALHRLSVLISQEKLLDRDIVAVDLRIPDRLTIEPAATAANATNAAPAKEKHP
jgi:cell division protein FtsQ